MAPANSRSLAAESPEKSRCQQAPIEQPVSWLLCKPTKATCSLARSLDSQRDKVKRSREVSFGWWRRITRCACSSSASNSSVTTMKTATSVRCVPARARRVQLHTYDTRQACERSSPADWLDFFDLMSLADGLREANGIGILAFCVRSSTKSLQ